MTSEDATDEALRALAEPRRRVILRLVAHDELSAGEIAGAFDVSRTGEIKWRLLGPPRTNCPSCGSPT